MNESRILEIAVENGAVINNVGSCTITNSALCVTVYQCALEMAAAANPKTLGNVPGLQIASVSGVETGADNLRKFGGLEMGIIDAQAVNDAIAGGLTIDPAAVAPFAVQAVSRMPPEYAIVDARGESALRDAAVQDAAQVIALQSENLAYALISRIQYTDGKPALVPVEIIEPDMEASD